MRFISVKGPVNPQLHHRRAHCIARNHMVVANLITLASLLACMHQSWVLPHD